MVRYLTYYKKYDLMSLNLLLLNLKQIVHYLMNASKNVIYDQSGLLESFERNLELIWNFPQTKNPSSLQFKFGNVK